MLTKDFSLKRCNLQRGMKLFFISHWMFLSIQVTDMEDCLASAGTACARSSQISGMADAHNAGLF